MHAVAVTVNVVPVAVSSVDVAETEPSIDISDGRGAAPSGENGSALHAANAKANEAAVTARWILIIGG